MAVKVAINGFGRIGRLVFRAIVEQGLIGKEVEVVAVGDIVPADNLAYLLKYDSTQGRFRGEVGSKKSSADKSEDDVLVVNGKEMKVVSAKSPAELPWKQLGVEVVIESTGLFTEVEKAQGHLTAGAKKVIISAPAKGDCPTIVMGVNENKYDPKSQGRTYQFSDFELRASFVIRHSCSHSFLYHVLQQIRYAAAIPPLVVIPAHQLKKTLVQLDSGALIENRRGARVNEV